MPDQTSLATVLSSGALSTALVGVLLWLTRTWVAERLRLAIKDELVSIEQNVKISRVFDKQAEAIAAIYERFMKMHESFFRTLLVMNKGVLPDEAQKKDMVECHEEFRIYYSQKLIYVSRTIAEMLRELRLAYQTRMQQIDRLSPTMSPADVRLQARALEVFLTGEGKALEATMRQEFQALMGVVTSVTQVP